MKNFKCENCGKIFSGALICREESGKLRLCPWCMSDELSISSAVCSCCGSDIFEGERLYETAAGEILCEDCVTERTAGI